LNSRERFGMDGRSGVFVFPTDTVYGVGCAIDDLRGMERIYELKKRDPAKPLVIYVTNLEEALSLARDISETGFEFMRLFMPGPVTVLLRPTCAVPEIFVREGLVGLRVQGNAVTNELISWLKKPLAGTSANFSNEPSPSTFDMIPAKIVEEADLAIDNGPTLYSRESTVVDLSMGEPRVLREGAISTALIEKAMFSRNRSARRSAEATS
jgi:L-threonylcarbamoyladenylate synthase